jgi:hypothetical protein
MNSRKVHIHIDRLVVEDLPAHAQQRFVHALENQLTRMVDAQAPRELSASGSRRIASLDAGRMRAGATPEQAAAQVTAALHGKLAGKGINRHG